MFELALAFEAGIELLTRVLVALSVGLEQVAPTVGEDDRDVAPAVQPHRGDQPLFAEVAKIALPRIRFPVEVVAQIPRGHDPKRADRRERPRFGTAHRVSTLARVVDDLTLGPAREMEI